MDTPTHIHMHTVTNKTIGLITFINPFAIQKWQTYIGVCLTYLNAYVSCMSQLLFSKVCLLDDKQMSKKKQILPFKKKKNLYCFNYLRHLNHTDKFSSC